MKKKLVTQKQIDEVWLLAVNLGWAFLTFQANIKMISFQKGDCRLNYYMSTGTVGTALNHPKKNKTQLFRKNIKFKELVKIFKNPRQHTGKGYYNK